MCDKKRGFFFSVLSAISVLAVLSVFTGCYKKNIVWYNDFNAALSAAQAENKNIFLLFTGLQWDTVSEELKKNIFDTEEFKREAGKKYILLHIDVDNINTAADENAAKAKYRLAASMGVAAAPTALLVTKTGQPFAFLPMTVGTKAPADVLKLLRSERRNEKKIDALYAKMQKTSGIDRIKAINAYIEAIPDRFYVTLTDLFSQIIESDPENVSGLLGKYKLRMAAQTAAAAFAASDFDKAVNTLLVLIGESDLLTPLEIQETYYAAAYYAAQSGKISKKEVAAYLQQAYNASPDSEKAADLLRLIDTYSGVQNPASGENLPDAISVPGTQGG